MDFDLEQQVAYSYAEDYSIENIRSALNNMFKMLGYPIDNPLGEIIKPGMTVFIKPNWVASKWRESCSHKDDLYCIITHPNVLEVVVDYVALALNGNGKIIIGDNPSIDADFGELMRVLKIEHLKTKYDVPCEILDLRPLICNDLKNYGNQDKMLSVGGDPLGQEVINLGKRSLLYNLNPRLFRGVFEQRSDTIAAHTKDTQLYGFSKTIYDADVFVSIPKMKTHHKVGVTLNLKGLVGAVAEKNHLVHWRVGFPSIGGDEYPDFASWFLGLFKKVKERGAWNGNDTIWRMVVDLYHAMYLKERKYFSVVDGIIGGEGKGPFCAYSKNSKVLLAGENLLAVDLVTTKLMGLDPYQIPYLKYFLDNEMKLESIKVYGTNKKLSKASEIKGNQLDYYPAENWKNLRKDHKWR